MSDAPVGWAELLAAPLGKEPIVETPLATLPCLRAPPEAWDSVIGRRPTTAEP
jgi:hypothetical protein